MGQDQQSFGEFGASPPGAAWPGLSTSTLQAVGAEGMLAVPRREGLTSGTRAALSAAGADSEGADCPAQATSPSLKGDLNGSSPFT